LYNALRSELLGFDDTDSDKFMTTDKGLEFLEGYERVATGSAKKEPPKGLLHAP
jgi:predicted transcriptional regulator